MKLRIREILKEQGKTADWLSEQIDMAPSQVSRFLTGRRRTNTEFLSAVAKALNVSLADLFQPFKIPIVGMIGAGAEFHPIDDHMKGGGLEEVDAPPGCPSSAVAVTVRGSSMWPVYNEGDILIYTERRPDIYEFLNRRCICGLSDGRILLKTPVRGSSEGLFTLTSFNAAPIKDVSIEWCAKIIWVLPK